MNSLIIQIAQFFVTIMKSVSKAGFGPTGAIAWATIFLGIAAIRILFVYKEFGQGSDLGGAFLAFLKTYWRMAVIWFLIAASPFIFQSIASFVQGNVTRAAQGPIATQAQGLLDTMMDDIEMMWTIRAVAAKNIWDQLPPDMTADVPAVFHPSITSATTGLANAATILAKQSSAFQSQAQQQIARGMAMQKSSNPKMQAAGKAIVQNAHSQQQLLASTAGNLVNQFVAIQTPQGPQSSSDSSGVFAALIANLNPLVWIFLWIYVGIASLLVVGPALVLAVSATVKVVQSAVEIFTFLFGFASMVVVVSALAVVLGPLAMISFVSDQWSRYGWNFVSFWIQAMVASVAVVVLTGIVGAAFGSLGTFMSQAAVLVAGAAASNADLIDMALQTLLAGIAFLGMGLALSFFSSFLQKSLSGATAMVHGSLHP